MKALYIFICLLTAIALSAYEPKEEFDFRENGFCFNIISEEEKTVETTTGDTNPAPIPEEPDPFYINGPTSWTGNSYKGAADVPMTTIHDGKEYKVVAIGPGTFVRCWTLTEVYIPEGIVRIDEGAFAFCRKLNRIEMPESVNELGNYTFYFCHPLTDLILSENITVIPKAAVFGAGYYETELESGSPNLRLHNYGNIEEIRDDAFARSAIREFDFSITKILGSDKLGDNLFTDSYIQEITLPTTWADADYAVLIGKICDGGVPQKLARLVLNRDVPPAVDAEQTTDIPESLYSQVALEVPQESVEAYRTSAFWSRFTNIKALGIDGVRESEEGTATYYTIDGLPLQGEPDHGIFIRRQGNKAEKVIL